MLHFSHFPTPKWQENAIKKNCRQWSPWSWCQFDVLALATAAAAAAAADFCQAAKPWPKCSANAHAHTHSRTVQRRNQASPIKVAAVRRRSEVERQWQQANVDAADDLGEFARQLWPALSPALQVELAGIDCLPAWQPGHYPCACISHSQSQSQSHFAFAFRIRISQFSLALAIRIRISHARFHSLCLPSAFIKSNCENLFAISIRSHVGCQLATSSGKRIRHHFLQVAQLLYFKL